MQCSAGKPCILAFMKIFFDTYHTPKQCCRWSISPCVNGSSRWQWSQSRTTQPVTLQNSSGMAQGTWHRAQGIKLVSKFPRSQFDWTSMGQAITSLIHSSLTLDQTWLWPIKAWTQDLRRCPVVSGTSVVGGLWVLWVARWDLHGSHLLQHSPRMFDWIRISGIWGQVKALNFLFHSCV